MRIRVRIVLRYSYFGSVFLKGVYANGEMGGKMDAVVRSYTLPTVMISSKLWGRKCCRKEKKKGVVVELLRTLL